MIKPEDRASIGRLQYYKRKKAYAEALQLLNNAPDIIKKIQFISLRKV
ncbi:hypothetical protein N480_22250 [Pseudoalteromonas luteoviolacea S2607]|nr:hypothetical protein N480_22250 [Pseudoalteromonas luteoviolacea S2607]